jgi:hypothetical protein
MYRGLVTSGIMLAIFGGFLVTTDMFVPMGLSGFGIPILGIGLVMVVIGLRRSEPAPVEAELGKKFCWYCMTQIPISSTECPSCSLPQHEAIDTL